MVRLAGLLATLLALVPVAATAPAAQAQVATDRAAPASVVSSGPVAADVTAAAEEVYAVPASGSWTVDGHGWGHGIGMSQWGAQAAALRGLTAEQILDFYYPGTVRYDIGQDFPLRVLLTAFSGTVATFGPVPGGSVVVTDGATGATATLAAGTRVVVSRTSSGLSLTSVAGGTSTPLALGGRTTVAGPVRVAGSGGAHVWAYRPDGSGTRYPGTVLVHQTTTGVQVVNHVPMEQYLRGVVPRESPASWAAAALQAQAVAARSYALAVRGSDTATYHLCDTTQCQVYGGSAVVSAGGEVTERFAASTDAAVLATARIARYYGGGPAFTQFSSSNGGYSKVGSRPYLVARADPYTGTAPGDRVSTWSDTLTVARVQQSCPSGGTLQRMVLTRDGNGDLGGRVLSARLECTTGVATVATPAFGLLSSWWRPSDVGRPVGTVDSVAGPAGGGVTVRGWAVDPDDITRALDVRITVGSSSWTIRAGTARPDVAAVLPGAGEAHGLDVTVPASPGTARVCVTVVNVGPGADLDLGCRDVTVLSGSPYGALDAATGVPASGSGPQGVVVRGWAVDPDAGTASVTVVVTVDGTERARAVAAESRPDVGAALPGLGDLHGYTVRAAAGPGSHRVCVLVVNTPSGASPTLSCRDVTVPGGAPTGQLERAVGGPAAVTVSGWMIDPDTANPGYVWVDVDGSGRPVVANLQRPDVASAYPAYGSAHGYATSVTVSPGEHRVCVTAVDGQGGAGTLLGCRQVTATDGSPIGSLESVTAVPGGIRVRGWVLDPETSASTYVWADVAGTGRPVLAALRRDDVARVYPATGPNHGFDVVVPAPPGRQLICLTGVNTGQGADTRLGCTAVDVPSASPRGNVEVLRPVTGGIEVAGWALDPDTPNPIYVWVDVSGEGRPVLASAVRTDVGAAFPALGAAHGFRVSLARPPGTYWVSVTAVNVGQGSDVRLAVGQVTVR